jgi:hypothetical protein
VVEERVNQIFAGAGVRRRIAMREQDLLDF